MKFRLSTAVVMMLVAAVLLWLNLMEWPHEYRFVPSIDYDGPIIAYGMPFTICYAIRSEAIHVPPDNIVPAFTYYAWQPLNLGLNIVFFVVTVLGIGFVLERIVFRAANNSNRVEARE